MQKELPWLDACVQETLRLFPPVMSLQRTFVGDAPVRLPSGPQLAKGDVIGIRAAGIQRNPSYWHRAGEFVPQRWLDRDGAKDVIFSKPAEQHQNYMPVFNGGRRLCLGKHMALVEAKSCLAALLRAGVALEPVAPGRAAQRRSVFTSTAVIAMKKGLRVTVN